MGTKILVADDSATVRHLMERDMTSSQLRTLRM